MTSPPNAEAPDARDDATVVVAAAGDGSLGARLARLTGARIVPVQSEASALEALEAHPAEMLVVDADALGEEAFALVSAAHERWPGLPVLLQSAAPIARRELALLAAAEVELCAMAAAWTAFLLLRSSTNGPTREALTAAAASASATEALPASQGGTPVSRPPVSPPPADHAAALTPGRARLPSEAEAPPVVVVNSPPRAVDPARVRAAGPRHGKRREHRRTASAPASERAPAAADVASSAKKRSDRAPAPEAPRPRPRGAECESSSECQSRLCVAYACQ